MATGTEGPDHLVNDTNVDSDFINALGGDDTIQISASGRSRHTVTVSGGSGFDTLTYSGFMWGMGPNSLITGFGTFSPRNEIFHSGVERLVINASAVSFPDSSGFPSPAYFTTGDTIDYLTIDAVPRIGSVGADVHVSTGGGDDRITLLRGAGPFSTVHAGSGNDLIDLTATFGGFFSAYGGEGNDTLLGTVYLDVLDGGPGDDFISTGGGTSDFLTINDTARGGDGNDVVYSGARLDPSDRIDGGNGNDRLVLQGDYSTGLVLGGDTVRGIETISLLSASDPTYSAAGAGLYDYVLTTQDSNFAPGVQARIDGAGLLAGEDLTFNGSAETDARFLVYGGKGADRVTGGLGNDVFFFGDGGRFAPGDVVNGGAGYDELVLRGSYSINFNAPGHAGALANLEILTLSSAADLRYASGGGSEFDYDVIWADALLGPGQTITIGGSSLQANETLTFHGSAERDGSFLIFAGAANDMLFGGRGADLFFGGFGGDRLVGNGGNDVFRYDLAAESTSAARDSIRDFTSGDLVDLSRIDASTLSPGDQAFSFIGTAAFGNRAGELRLVSQGSPVWLVQGDTDGNGLADFELLLYVIDAHPVTSADFLL